MASTDVRYTDRDIVQAAAAAENRYAEPPGATGSVWRMTAVRFTPATAVTAHDTDYVTLSVKKGSSTVAAYRANSSPWRFIGLGQERTVTTPASRTARATSPPRPRRNHVRRRANAH